MSLAVSLAVLVLGGVELSLGQSLDNLSRDSGVVRAGGFALRLGAARSHRGSSDARKCLGRAAPVAPKLAEFEDQHLEGAHRQNYDDGGQTDLAHREQNDAEQVGQ